MNWIGGYDAGWFAGWLGSDDETGTIPGFGPDGVATFVLELENGYTVTYRWPTALKKMRSGKEQRDSRLDASKESYEGDAVLFDNEITTARSQLARYASLGSVFMLALPHEQLSIRQDASGPVVYVHSTAERDWMNPGQRVVCMWRDENGEMQTADGVIQTTTADSISLDVAPGSAANLGGAIMPLRAVYLEPEQAFPRYLTRAETWQLRARAASFDFAMTLASLALGPLTAHVNLENASVTARVPGSAPYFQMVGDGVSVTLEETADTVIVHFQPGPFAPSSLADIYAALQTSTLVAPTGTWGSGVVGSGSADEVPLTQLTGGQLEGPVGTGATVTQYASHPLWDRPLENDSTITDSIHALTSIIDHDGVPYSVGMADMADGGRAILATGQLGEEFQWLKLFLDTVKGPQKGFWLSTQREDLDVVSHAAEYITVDGDVAAWYPAQRQHIHVQEADGTSVYCRINAAVDNGDGTWELQTDAAPFTDPVTVSWVDFCRFTSEEIPVRFDEYGWTLNTTATATQETADGTCDTYLEAESSSESSSPRELFKISINDGVDEWFHTSSTRDIAYDGERYTAIALARGEVAITMPGAEKDLILTLPIDHAFVRRWTAGGNPPRKAELIVYRQNGGETETIWSGRITSLNAEKEVAKFRVPSRAGEWMLRQLPAVTVGRECSHVLYDSRCGVSRTGSKDGLAFKVTASVIYVNGRDVRVDLASTDRNGDWAEGGELVHSTSGERMTIALQTDLNPGVSAVADLRMQMPIRGLAVGDSVDVYAGCDHTIATCRDKFDVRVNFGGLPQSPTEILFTPAGARVASHSWRDYLHSYLGGGIPGLVQEWIYPRWYAPAPATKSTEVALPRSDDGAPVPLIYGRCRVARPILAWAAPPYADEGDVGNGWPTGEPFYRMSMLFALGAGFDGGTNQVFAMWSGEAKFFLVGTAGEVETEQQIELTPTAASAPGQVGGTWYVYDGNEAQDVATTLGGTIMYDAPEVNEETGARIAGTHAIASTDEISGHRRMLSVLLYNGQVPDGDGFYPQWIIGSSASAPAYSFEASSYKDTGMPAVGIYARIGYDSNPINVLYDLFVDKLGIPSSYIDSTTWDAAAITLYNESHGYSRCIDDVRAAAEHIIEILRQIDAALYFDENSQTFKLKLIRNDFTPSLLPQITKDNCRELVNFASGSWYNLPNKIRLIYTNADDDYRDASATARNQANAVGQDGVQIEHQIEMRGVTNGTLAATLAARELSALSRPLMKCRAIVSREFIRVNPGDAVRVQWTNPDIANIVFRVAGVDRGTLEDGWIALDLMQDTNYVFRGRIPEPPALIDGGGVDGGGLLITFG